MTSQVPRRCVLRKANFGTLDPADSNRPPRYSAAARRTASIKPFPRISAAPFSDSADYILFQYSLLLLSTLAIFWAHPPEIRAPKGRGIAMPVYITIFCRAQRIIKTPLQSARLSIPFLRTMHPTLFLPAGFQLAVTVLLAFLSVRLFFFSPCMVPLRVNQFVYSLHLRPTRRNFLKGDLTLPINNAMLGRFLKDGKNNLATRWSPPQRFYDVANCLTPNRIRDDPNQPTLTSVSFMGPFMTVAICTNACANSYLAMAGLENGNKCCECTSRRCLPSRPLIS